MSGLFIKKANLWGILSLMGIVSSAAFLPQSFSVAAPVFSGLLVNDSFSGFFRGIFLLVSFIVVLISMGYKTVTEDNGAEYYFLLLTATIAMMFVASAANFITIYLALEAVSLTSYILVGFLKRDNLSSEAALKYFLFGTLATGIMLYGISFIYGLSGSTDLSAIHAVLANGGSNSLILCVAMLLIFCGIAFKCAFFPFHMWSPDVYQGAPTSISAFVSVGPKAVGFAILLRVFMKDIFPLFPSWVNFFTVISIATMTVGNIIALSQTNIKRMLAYSSIAQAGYILIGFVAGTPLGVEAVLFYILAYTLMNLGAFACIVLISNSIKSDLIEHYAGLHKRNPRLAFMLTIFLLSLAGIPPLAGFLGKFLVFAAAIEARFIFLAVAGIINSVIALYYYVRVVKYMYLDEPKTEGIQPQPAALEVALTILLLGVLIVGLWPHPFLNWIAKAVL